MTNEEITEKEEIVNNEDDSLTESETNQTVYNEEEYLTGDDKKEVNNENTDGESDSSSSQDDDSNTEEDMTLSLKDDSELFVLSVDGVPRFYTKTVDEARDKMMKYARFRRIQETHYNTYIRACPDKNRLEVVGSHKFSVFMVDRTICWLLVSLVQELETTKVQKNIGGATAPPSTPSTPKVDSPPKRGFFSSFFW